jgi:hypothetical protein
MMVNKWVNSFIEYDITGNVNATRRNAKALKSFVHVVVAKKDTFYGAILKFVSVIGTEIGLASKFKDSQARVVG